MNTIVALVPVRSGSVRVSNKNLRPFAGSSLLEIKLMQLLAVSEFDHVVVSSNDQEMLDTARRLGAVARARDQAYATDKVPMSDVYSHMASQVDSELILLTHVTNPMVMSDTYRRAIHSFYDNIARFDSLTTVTPVLEFLHGEDGKAINYDPLHKPRSQDLPKINKLNHAISIVAREHMITQKEAMGHNPLFMELSQLESVDIDTPLDFEVAEFLYRKRVEGRV